MRNKLIPAVILAVLVFSLPAYAQFAKVGTVGLKFLDIGVGARALAMGEAYAAVSDDAASLFWNPAGISNVKSNDFFAGYTKWPAEINLYSAAFVRKTNFGHIGASFTILNTGLMNRTSEYDNDGVFSGTFAYEDWAAGLTYSRYLTDKFAFGATFKLLKEKIADWDVSGWAVDIGTYYHTGFKSLRIGMAILNFGPDLRYEIDDIDGLTNSFADGIDNDGDGYVDNNAEEAPLPLPLSFRAGMAMEVYESSFAKATVSSEIMHPADNEERYNFGSEVWFQELLAVRAGYKLNSDVGGFTAGVGIKLPLSSFGQSYIDYAFNDFGDLEGVHRGSFSISF